MHSNHKLRIRDAQRNGWARRCAVGSQRRAGLSLVVVMIAISMSLVLTYSFTSTQTTVMQIADTGIRRDLALSAAHTGAAEGMRDIQNPQWGGVASTLSRNLVSDEEGTSSYRVEYRPYPTDGSYPAVPDPEFHLLIHSTGTWRSADGASKVDRVVEVVVRLMPRVPGRIVTTTDSVNAVDEPLNPGDYETIQDYALFASSGSESLILDPRDRIDGDIWLNDDLRLFRDPSWSSTVRNEYLNSVGAVLAPDGNIRYPHPLNGTVNFEHDPSAAQTEGLAALHVPWNNTSTTLSQPAIDFSKWTSYQLYKGGPVYAAQLVDSSLSNTTLRPSPSNPLGIFFRSGSVAIYGDVTIQGTLVCDGTVSIYGNGVLICAYNWREADGQFSTPDADKFRRMPAVVARELTTDRTTRAIIEGAVVLDGSLTGAGGDYELQSVTDVNISGTATAQPLEQPFSLVSLEGTPDLSNVSDDGGHAVWLADGNTGNWYPIADVDRAAGTLTVYGEVDIASSTAFRIARERVTFFVMRGPVSGTTHNINRPNAWAEPSSLDWDTYYAEWETLNAERELLGEPLIEFSEYVKDPLHLTGLLYPNDTYGLGLEPTFHLRATPGVRVRWEPPLFEPFIGTGDDEPYSGYRWRVVSWREAH